MKIANKRHMDRVIENVRGTVILHNFLISDTVDDDWFGEWSDEQEDDLEPEPSSRTNEPDYRRRQELLYYLSEIEETQIN